MPPQNEASPANSSNPGAVRRRLDELAVQLAGGPPDEALFEEWGRAWNERLTLLLALGETDEAERHITTLLQLYPQYGEAAWRWRAETLHHLANLYTSLGRLDEALHIRREEQLPLCAKLGDERARAVTLGNIAEILAASGRLGEALRIRREEELPVYESLGDMRELVICRAMIAQMLAKLGNSGDMKEMTGHLAWAWREAVRMQLPEAAPIEQLAGMLGLPPETLKKLAETA